MSTVIDDVEKGVSSIATDKSYLQSRLRIDVEGTN